MEICLRKKKAPTHVEEGSTHVEAKKELNIDDFDLADSDREDYHNNVDILFVLDTTGSMGSYIGLSIQTIKKIVENFSKMEFNIKFSLCTYRDHPPQDSSYVTEFTDLSSAKKLVEVLSKVTAAGGGDGPEAVMDGLREGLSKTTWRFGEDGTTVSKRFIFHICDAPPHGEEYGGHSSDASWQKNGCPCGTKKEDINKLLKDNKVDYHLIKAVTEVNKMEQIFKDCFTENYAETIVLDPSATGNSYGYECEEYCSDEDDEDDCDYENNFDDEEEQEECVKEEKCCEMKITNFAEYNESEEIGNVINNVEELSMKDDCAVMKCKMEAPARSKKSKVSAASSVPQKKQMWEQVISALDKKLA